MSGFIKTLLLTATGRISKTKLTILVTAALNVASEFGWVSWTPEQMLAVNGFAVGLAGLFLRDALDGDI